MIERLCNFLYSLFSRGPVRLAIVRRYADANGAYVGELYLERERKGISCYEMVGVSLDSLQFDLQNGTDVFALDTRNDFLAPMPPMTLRVGSQTPGENEAVRKMIRRLPRHNMRLIVQNKFIEHVLEHKL